MKTIVPENKVALIAALGEESAEETSPVGEIPVPMQARLEELGRLLPDSAELILARDWEGCIFGVVNEASYPAPFDVLAFTEDGRIGHGGINQPRYEETVDALT